MLREKCCDMFKTIGNAVKPTATSGVQRVLLAGKKGEDHPAPINQTEFLGVTKATDIVRDHVIDWAEIEKRLLEFNRRHFRLAAESPCGHGIIYDALQFSSLTSEGYELLRRIVPESWHGNKDLLKEFLASFVLSEALKDTQPINTHITNDDFVYGIKGSWKETTSTSPSGRHLGHYKALIQDYLLLDLEVKVLNILLQPGISLQQWSNSINVMIEKDPNMPTIHQIPSLPSGL